MIQYRIPVRNNVPQLLQYTFLDQNGNIISLNPYVLANLELKLQGEIYATVAAVILIPATSGVVQVASHTFIEVGVWDAQFYAADGANNRLYGEPLQFVVVPNVDDAALNQLLYY